ncbi:MAG: CT583 family protein [Parachlamydiaceae bacterium]|nr:CT583 family protein [Parachlamydiaceae bacterium]
MSNVNDLLSLRTKKGENLSKMAEMAKQSASGQLTSFSGVFSVEELSGKEKAELQDLLTAYSTPDCNLSSDLQELISLSSEVKAINNQAALLHGERIKKAHFLLTRYRDGAFTSWLMAIYGNRQTPYNFLQYYEFYQTLTRPLRLRVEQMPRQAVYTLASRTGSLERKQELIATYNGETKAVLLETIRHLFPLEMKDKRRENFGDKALSNMRAAIHLLTNSEVSLSKAQKNSFCELLNQLRTVGKTL